MSPRIEMNKSESESLELLNKLTFCVLDLETTGGNTHTDRIIEIGLVKIENLKIVEERNYLINPKRDIPEFIQKLTGIKNEDVAQSPTIEDVLDEVRLFIGDSILVAHNTSFDVPFLNATLRKNGSQELDNNVLCTNIMTKYLIPEIMSSNLNYMSTLFNIPHTTAHRAIEDAKACGQLLIHYLQIFAKKEFKKVNQLYYPRNKFELDRVTLKYEQKDEAIKLLQSTEAPSLLSVKAEKGVILGHFALENPLLDYPLIKKMIEESKWEQITFKLCAPLVEALTYTNHQFYKIPEIHRQAVLDFHINKYGSTENGPLDESDFLVTPHLIQGQLYFYSLNTLAPFGQLLFKYPGHKKKLWQFVQTQLSKVNQKKPRKHFLFPEFKPIINSYLKTKKESNDQLFLFLNANEIHDNQKLFFKKLEELMAQNFDPYKFPEKHL
jgi:DNA polymerase-3 subunit epsilon